MPSEAWKRAERAWASILGGQRRPSQGGPSADILGPDFAAEHKLRKYEEYSAEFRKAIRQHDQNKREHPNLLPLVLFTFYEEGRRGHRRFMMVEYVPGVVPKLKDFIERISERADI